jgi:hypothetical protein
MKGDAARRDAVLAKFRSLYGAGSTAYVRAPGRAELLGTDTDDHLGYVNGASRMLGLKGQRPGGGEAMMSGPGVVAARRRTSSRPFT